MEQVCSSFTYIQQPTLFEQETQDQLAILITTICQKQNNWQETAASICQELTEKHQWKYFQNYPHSEIVKKMAILGIACLLHGHSMQLEGFENITSSNLLTCDPFFQEILTCLIEQNNDTSKQELLESEWNQKQKEHLFYLLRSLCHNLAFEIHLSTYLKIDAYASESEEQQKTRQCFITIFTLTTRFADRWKADLAIKIDPHCYFILDAFPIYYLAEHPGDLRSMITNLTDWLRENNPSSLVWASLYKFCTHAEHLFFPLFSKEEQDNNQFEYARSVNTNIAHYLELYDSIVAMPPSFERSSYLFSVAHLMHQYSNNQELQKKAANLLTVSINYWQDHWKKNGWHVYYSEWIQLGMTLQKELDPNHDFSKWKALLTNDAPQQDPIIKELLQSLS